MQSVILKVGTPEGKWSSLYDLEENTKMIENESIKIPQYKLGTILLMFA